MPDHEVDCLCFDKGRCIIPYNEAIAHGIPKSEDGRCGVLDGKECAYQIPNQSMIIPLMSISSQLEKLIDDSDENSGPDE